MSVANQAATEAKQPSCPQSEMKSTDVEPNNWQDKYELERAKRLRPDRLTDFLDLYSFEKFRHFKADPWLKEKPTSEEALPPQNGSRREILIIGGGWTGLVTAVRLLQAGFRHEEIRIVDFAGGFDWNRYPGLYCDVESYIYAPLLEETGYMPTEKYATGKELREHAERIAKKWNLHSIAHFQQRVSAVDWDDERSEWVTTTHRQLQDGREADPVKLHSRFVFLATGLLFVPHVPVIPGIQKFQGPCFHTARWDYNATGGSPENPDLVKLKDKRVGILGTGATAVQVVPNLARHCKELLVFQRTPPAVDRRGNHPTDPEWASSLRYRPGWQKSRTENFQDFITNNPTKPSVDLVKDGWTRMLSYSALAGQPDLDCRTPEQIQDHVKQLYALDLPRQESIRKRVKETVKDPEVAAKLMPWYPGWCKRPCFHDEFLQVFNQPNVELVDTNGMGITEITESSAKVGDQEHKIDVLILGTGYRSLFVSSPAGRVDINIKGREGLSFDKKWADGVGTLHGMMSRGFPNLFWPGLNQAGGSPNFTACIEVFAEHVISMMSHAMDVTELKQGTESLQKDYRCNFTIEPTAEAEEEWVQQIVSQAGAFASLPLCTPNTYNGEGRITGDAPPEELAKGARLGLWARGPNDFARVLREWRADKQFKGLDIKKLPL